MNFSSAKLWIGLHLDAFRHWPAVRRQIVNCLTGSTILVTGLPRSGTTWLGAMLSMAGIWQVHEPFSPYQRLRNTWFDFMDPDGIDASIDELIHDLLKGKHRHTLTIPGAYVSSPLMPLRWWPLRPNRVLIKDPTACLLSGYLARHHDMQVVWIRRHPAAVFESTKRLGWDLSGGLTKMLNDSSLLDGQLGQWRQKILALPKRDASSVRAAAIGIRSKVLELFAIQFGFLTVDHEVLAADWKANFDALHQQLSIPRDDVVLSRQRAICEPFSSFDGSSSPTSPYQVKRNSQAQLNKWTNCITTQELDCLRATWDALEIEHYNGTTFWSN